ncbi:alpha-2-macroglobulin family protein [Aquimarina sp. 2201CG5-10]|uniref:alpha-2-macroglobulin family protein n=1 Tax=Aquimarina callyspongiae TaxID=3098150 RepID=UPI002AB565F4|nr:MG2 domain-containing protein [Aquimarina sp. 2201CG5-10]MDY8137030.1 MG2 domain-containing protein [Aquimarina sp. 2201CG5-10]
MRLSRIFYSLLFVTLIFSCKKKDVQSIAESNASELNKYNDYISDVSSGVISVMDNVYVVLQTPVAEWDDNQELSKDLLEVSPKVRGKVIAVNNRTISFQPEDGFKEDTAYSFTLNLEDLVEELAEGLDEDFVFSVKTLKQQFSVITDNLQSYSKDWQYIDGTLTSSDQMKFDVAKQLITATQKDKNISVNFSESAENSRQFSFRIDSIQRFEDDSEITVKWSGKPFDISTEGEDILSIPGKNNFKVISVAVANVDNQYVEINFTDPLKKNQNFDGLVTITGARNIRYTVDGNVLKAYPKKELKGTLNVTVFEGIRSTDNYKLKSTYTENVSFQQPKPEIRLLQSGVILPTSDNLKFNFEAINLRAVEVQVIKVFENNILQFLQRNDLNGSGDLRSVARPVAKKLINLQENASLNLSKWNAFAIDLKELITPDPGAIYRIELNFKKTYSLYKCEGETADLKPIEELAENYDEEASESSFWDNAQYYNDYYYDYDWNERDNPCSNSYYNDRKITANVLASNLGVVVKKGLNHSYTISVNDIITTNPVSNARVTFYNYQQQEIGVATTDAEGLTGFDSDGPAFFAIASSGRQQTYVKLNDGNALSVSKFDVSGVRLQKGIKGFIYGERGVWRPGDTLFLSFMLNDNANKLPVGHPVKFELRDPYGKVTYQETKTKGVNNFYKFIVNTSDEAPTGNWQAKVLVGGASFAKTLKIETIKPNRLKIKTTFDDEVLGANKKINGNLEVLWLHGAIAKNLQTDINVRFTPQKTSFKTFPGYSFDDPSRKFRTEEQEVFQGKISEEGKASFNLTPTLNNKAAGMLRASFITKVYENGGDFSTDVISKDFSPYNTYIGLNTPKGDKARGMLLTDTKHKFEVVSVDENGNPKAVKDLIVSIYKVKWRWWWDTSEDNLSSYNQSSYRERVFNTKVSTDNNGKANFNFELKYPEWGRYLVRVVDPNGGHATGKTIYIDWPGWAGKSRKNDPSAATMLLFSTDKKTYNVGEKAIVTFPSSEGGRALVTVENGTEVLSSQWVIPQKGETKFELPIEELYTPNVYINITLLQPHSSTANDLPIRLYGVVPISVEDPQTKVQPKLNMPDVLRPEETITLKVGESSGKAMTYSIAIVDEGLLDLTRYKTPNPWNSFYAREALGVKTWDIYDDVIGAYGGNINQIFSIGGDAEAGGSKSKKANRFKPMVVYKGPFELKKGETRSHEIRIPKYVGSVRTMIVASDAENAAYGSVDKTTPVRKPLMVLTSIPRKITPGEKVTIPVTVFAMENKVKNVKVTLKPNKGFTVIGEASKNLSFSQPDEKMAYFDIEVIEGASITDIEVVATGNGEKASYKVPIDIVNPNPMTTEVTSIILEPNSQQEINFASFGVDGSNSATIELSSLPPMNFESRLQYLIRYPHGCIEQTTSAAFPQLFLDEIFNLSSDKKQKIQYNVEAAINKMKRFIQPNGGMSYWPGYSNPNDWGTTYAGHFLLEANKRGYVLPIGFKSNWINYQQQQAKRWRSGNNDLAQAYRLYTLAFAGSPDLSSMNRLRETSRLSNDAKLRLAAAYGLIGQKSAADKLLNSASINFESSKKYYHYTYGSLNRNRAMALETLVLLDQKAEAQKIAVEMAKELSSKKWMSTQTTSYALMAMAKYATYVGGKGIQVNYTLNGKSNNANTDKTLESSGELAISKNNSLLLKNNKDNTIFVQLATSGILPVGQEKVIQSNFRAIVDYKTREGRILDVNQLTQGTDFVAEVTITNTTDSKVKDIALSEIFPSGWEVVNTRFTDFGSFKANKVTHTDIRDDRVNFYFDLKPGESKTVTILLNASYLGKYYLPGIQCEAMYDNDYLVRTQGKWVEVIK